MTYEQTLARKRVAKGIYLLDCEAGNWRELVDPEQLETTSYRYCVLGQVHGTYSEGLDALGAPGEWPQREVFSEKHGFDSSDRVSYQALDDAWREALA
jgi:hypothetical protein